MTITFNDKCTRKENKQEYVPVEAFAVPYNEEILIKLEKIEVETKKES